MEPYSENLTTKIFRWVQLTFGARSATDPKERAARVLEEAVELAQAVGITKDKALEQVWLTYSRPKGIVAQEIAGVGICWLSAALGMGIDPVQALDAELNRISKPENIELIREKQKSKITYAPVEPYSEPEPIPGRSS